MVVAEGGNVLHHVKREGKLSGREKRPREYVRGECPDATRRATPHTSFEFVLSSASTP